MAKINIRKYSGKEEIKSRVDELFAQIEKKIVTHEEFTGEDSTNVVTEFYDEDGLCLLTVIENEHTATFSFHAVNEEYKLTAEE